MISSEQGPFIYATLGAMGFGCAIVKYNYGAENSFTFLFWCLLAIAPLGLVESFYASPVVDKDILTMSIACVRVLLGLGISLAMLAQLGGLKRQSLSLPPSMGLEVFFLLVLSIYLILVWGKGGLTIGDGIFLGLFYLVYLKQKKKFASPSPDKFFFGPKLWLSVSFGLLLLALKTNASGTLPEQMEVFFPIVLAAGMTLGVVWQGLLAKPLAESFTLIFSIIISILTLLFIAVIIMVTVSEGKPGFVVFAQNQSQQVFLTVLTLFYVVLLLMDLNISLLKAVKLMVVGVASFFLGKDLVLLIMPLILIEMIPLVLKGKALHALTAFKQELK